MELTEFDKKMLESCKGMIREKLKDSQWLQNIRLGAKEYIKNNGTKTTTVDEIYCALKKEAFDTFPQDVMLKLIDEM